MNADGIAAFRKKDGGLRSIYEHDETKFFCRCAGGDRRADGYIHGHNHRWRKNWYHDGGYSRRAVKRSVCLPSTGWWGDIGYAEMRTFADRAELQLVENDFFFPKLLGKGESRLREWDEIMAENRASAHMTFPF